MRIFYTNPNRIGAGLYKKVEMLKRQIKSNQINVCLLSSPDRKWTKRLESILQTKLQIRSSKLIIIITDSSGIKKTKDNWLPGRTMSLITGKWANYIEEVHKDKYGQQNMIKLIMNGKSILIAMVYRLPEGSRTRIYTVKAQLDY